MEKNSLWIIYLTCKTLKQFFLFLQPNFKSVHNLNCVFNSTDNFF